MTDLMTLKLDLAARAAELAKYLLGEPNEKMSSSSTMRFRGKGSLSIGLQGKHRGKFKDFETSERGTLLDLIKRERACSIAEAIRFAQEFLGRPAEPAPVQPRSVARDESDPLRTERAVCLWNEALSEISGTPVELYLKSRGIELAPDICGRVLRFHPRCPFGEQGKRSPAMIALLRDIHTDEPRAIHRTALTPAGVKIGRKVLGPKKGTAIKFSDHADIHYGLTIGEGIETTLAGMMLGFSPAWGLGDADELGGFPVLAGLECLTILVDHDASGTGQRRALECSQRWTASGAEVFRAIPVRTGGDFNDILRSRIAA
jgi:hypothetical protein